jgi:hypothetical protein
MTVGHFKSSQSDLSSRASCFVWCQMRKRQAWKLLQLLIILAQQNLSPRWTNVVPLVLSANSHFVEQRSSARCNRPQIWMSRVVVLQTVLLHSNRCSSGAKRIPQFMCSSDYVQFSLEWTQRLVLQTLQTELISHCKSTGHQESC